MTDVVVHAPLRERTGLLWFTAAIVSVALAVVALDSLVVTTAFPTLQQDFTASIESLEWSVNAYILAFAVFLLVGVRLGDRYGHRRTFVLGLAIFTAASAACAVAPTIELFDAARALQGLAGALVAAPALTALGNLFPDERRAIATGLWWGIGAVALPLGPLAGGAIVDNVDWQWMFWANVPIGIVAMAFALVGLRETHGPQRRFDLPGLVFAGTGLCGIVWGLTRGHVDGWTSERVLPALGAGAILTAAFLVWELGASDPMLPRSLFRRRSFETANAVSLLFSFALLGTLVLLVQFLQLVRGETALRAGLALVPAAAAIVLVGPLAGVLSIRVGARPFVTLGLLLGTLGLAWFAYASAVDVSSMRLLPGFILIGAGVGMFLPPTAYLVLGSGRPADITPASSVNSAIRAAGGAIGVAALTAVLMSNGGYGSKAAFTDGLTRALWVAAAVAALGVVVSLVIPGRKRGVREVAATLVGEPIGHLLPTAEEDAGARELPATVASERIGHLLPTTEEPAALAEPPSDPDPPAAQEPAQETFPCPVCLGEGSFSFVPPRDPDTGTCPRCYGLGTVLTGSRVPAHMVRDCPDCHGRGYVDLRALHEDLQLRIGAAQGPDTPLEESLPEEPREP